jgi:hypothetical protein
MRLRLAVGLALLGACTRSEPAPEPTSPDDRGQAVAPATQEPEPEHAQEQEPEPDCDASSVAAARRALEIVLTYGVDAAALADCRPEQVTCARERTTVEPEPSCRIVAHRGDARWQIIVVPTPSTGAPTRFEVWTNESGSASGHVSVSGSTWGVVDAVRIEGRGEYKSHVHGGEPARIGGASFMVSNGRDVPVELKLTNTRWLVAYSCELPREEHARPAPAGRAREDGLVDGAMSVTIPAGASEIVRIGHAAQPAYMAHCDRFATAASFEVDGVAVEVIAEHHVTRREPLR